MIIASFPKGSFPENTWPVGTWPVALEVTDIQYTEVMEFAVCIAASADFDVVLPNDDVVSVADGRMAVSGAGTTEVNRIYAEYGTRGGKTRYRMASTGSPTGYFYIVWIQDYETWFISRRGEDANVDATVMAGSYYYSSDDVTTPNLCTTWAQGVYGSLPTPTITNIIPILTELAAFTVEMPTVIEFETYEELSA